MKLSQCSNNSVEFMNQLAEEFSRDHDQEAPDLANTGEKNKPLAVDRPADVVSHRPQRNEAHAHAGPRMRLKRGEPPDALAVMRAFKTVIHSII